jgi:GntR family phosphonate transport system transcriptional regulator
VTIPANIIERSSGIALWRQIADRIRVAINSGEFDGSGMLPGEIALAKRYGVNRHTVRSAIAALASEGVLRVEQGRGTFVDRHSRLSYPIGRRTRFSEGLAGQTRSIAAILKASHDGPASAVTARALGLRPGAPVVCLETVHSADGRPVSTARHWFDAERFPDIGRRFAELGSITACLRQYGIGDYFRVSTRISAQHADADMLRDLVLSAGAVVLRTETINADPEGRPVEYCTTCFAADRVELDIDHSAGQFAS